MNNLEQAKNIASQLFAAIDARLDQYWHERNVRDSLAGRTCTGTVHWRDSNGSGKTPKMYAIHGVDQPCPIHGEPEPGGRLRVYVGTDKARQQETLEAMEREQDLQDTLTRLKAMEYALDRAYREIADAALALGLDTDAEGDDLSLNASWPERARPHWW